MFNKLKTENLPTFDRLAKSIHKEEDVTDIGLDGYIALNYVNLLEFLKPDVLDYRYIYNTCKKHFSSLFIMRLLDIESDNEQFQKSFNICRQLLESVSIYLNESINMSPTVHRFSIDFILNLEEQFTKSYVGFNFLHSLYEKVVEDCDQLLAEKYKNSSKKEADTFIRTHKVYRRMASVLSEISCNTLEIIKALDEYRENRSQYNRELIVGLFTKQLRIQSRFDLTNTRVYLSGDSIREGFEVIALKQYDESKVVPTSRILEVYNSMLKS